MSTVLEKVCVLWSRVMCSGVEHRGCWRKGWRVGGLEDWNLGGGLKGWRSWEAFRLHAAWGDWESIQGRLSKLIDKSRDRNRRYLDVHYEAVVVDLLELFESVFGGHEDGGNVERHLVFVIS